MRYRLPRGIIGLLLAIAFLATLPASAAQSQSSYDQTNCWSYPNCWYYVRIQYSVPETVAAGKPFHATVQVSYKENQYFYTGYLDTYNVTFHVVEHPTSWWTPYGSDVVSVNDSSTVRSYFGGQAYSHTFTVVAPQKLGQYDVYVTWNTYNQEQDFLGWGPTHVNASTAEWNTANWSLPLPEFTTVIPPGYLMVGVKGLPNATSVSLDGTKTTLVEGTYLEVALNSGQHVVKVPSVVALGPGSQAVFTVWSDGIADNQRLITFNGTGIGIDAQYQVQYYLLVDSNYGAVQGTGWYNAGTSADFGTSTPSFFDPHILDHWQGDYDENSPTGTLVMNGPKQVVAVYRTDYSKIISVILVSLGVFGAAVAVVKVARRPKKRETRTPPSQTQQPEQAKEGQYVGKEAGYGRTVEEEPKARTTNKESESILVLRASIRAENDVREDRNLKSLSVLEAYLNSVRRCIVQYETATFQPTGAKLRVIVHILIGGEGGNGLVLFLAPTKDDPQAKFTITSVKNIYSVPRETRMQAALEPALAAEVRILPPGRGGYRSPFSQEELRAQQAETRARQAQAEAERMRQVYERRLHELSSESLEGMDPYVLLGISRTATREEVKAAKRRLELVYHPDRSRNPDSARMFIAIEKAYEKIENAHPGWPPP